MKDQKIENPIEGELTSEQLAELAKIDGEVANSEPSTEVEVQKVEEPKEKKPKVKVPEGENPQLTEALEPFRELVGSKPEKGCEKRVLAVIHKRAFDANGNMQSKPYAQYFDEREYQNFLKHPGGFIVELEIYNPFQKK